MQASKFGEPLCHTFQLELLCSSEAEWRKRMVSSAKVKAQYARLFADSISCEAKARRKGSKRKGKPADGTRVVEEQADRQDVAPEGHSPARKKVKKVTVLHHDGEQEHAIQVAGEPNGEADHPSKHEQGKKKSVRGHERRAKAKLHKSRSDTPSTGTDVNSVIDEVVAQLAIGTAEASFQAGLHGKKRKKHKAT
jgi:hypothetical protein